LTTNYNPPSLKARVVPGKAIHQTAQYQKSKPTRRTELVCFDMFENTPLHELVTKATEMNVTKARRDTNTTIHIGPTRR
jgi:hypothetical protein